MTRKDRLTAFSMRLDGMTWAQIGKCLSYSPGAVSKDLHRVLEKEQAAPVLLYPNLQRYMEKQCYGSVEAFAHAMHVSPHRLRCVLIYGDEPAESLVQKITEATGLTEKEAVQI